MANLSLFNKAQLTELVQSSYALQDDERANRVFTWIGDPAVRGSVCDFAAQAISAAAKEAVALSVDRCIDTVNITVNFGQHAARLLVANPELSRTLNAGDVLYAFRSLLTEQDFDLDEHGVLTLNIPVSNQAEEGDAPADEPVPVPEPVEPEMLPPVEPEHRAIVEKSVKDLVKEINSGAHDAILLHLLAAEQEKETPRTGVTTTLRTRRAWVVANA